jgi:BCD family chlorophyll transporter-like MFS transporter
MLREVTPERLQLSFSLIALVALAMGTLGLIGLEQRIDGAQQIERRYRLVEVVGEIRTNPQVSLFFLYLVLMLAAVLGQDVLLEPFAARAFQMPVSATTRITSIWGTCYLVSLVISGLLEGRISKITVARLASGIGVASFALVGLSGLLGIPSLFYLGLVLLGLATGPATVSNLSLMLDMTVPGKVGLFIGAWGSASAFARLVGALTTAGVRDLARLQPQNAVLGYSIGFWILGLFLLASLYILDKVNLASFRSKAQAETQASVVERAALAGEA